MERGDIERVLSETEERLASDPGAGLAGTGFWDAVGWVKRTPGAADEYADRIAAVEQEAFGRWALVRVPLGPGTAGAGLVTVIGLVLVALAYYPPDPWNGLLLLAGMGALLIATHGLAHLAVGRAVGIRFSCWFVGELKRPQPGVKIDYATYLAASPKGRAWMHASGAIASKVVPFALMPAGLVAGVPGWAVWLMAVTGVVSIITDVVWSTRVGDWKKFRREMAYAAD